MLLANGQPMTCRAAVNLPDKRTVMGRVSGITRSRLNCEKLTGLAPGWVLPIRPQHYETASVFSHEINTVIC